MFFFFFLLLLFHYFNFNFLIAMSIFLNLNTLLYLVTNLKISFRLTIITILSRVRGLKGIFQSCFFLKRGSYRIPAVCSEVPIVPSVFGFKRHVFYFWGRTQKLLGPISVEISAALLQGMFP